MVIQASWSRHLNLAQLHLQLNGARYDPRKFTGLIWKDPDVGGNCLVFGNGKVICSGSHSILDAHEMLRRYTELLKQFERGVHLVDVKLVTMSACHRLSGPVDLRLIVTLLGGMYEPELFNGAMLKRNRTNYTIFATGNVVIMGVKDEEDIYPILLELELCVKS